MKVLINVLTVLALFGLVQGVIEDPSDPNIGVAITVLVGVLFVEGLVEYWTKE